MEYERSIFRVSERTQPQQYFKGMSNFCAGFFFGTGFITLVVFLIAQVVFSNDGGIVKHNFDMYLNHQAEINPHRILSSESNPPASSMSINDNQFAANFTLNSKKNLTDEKAIEFYSKNVTQIRNGIYEPGDIVNFHFMVFENTTMNNNYSIIHDTFLDPKDYSLKDSVFNITFTSKSSVLGLIYESDSDWFATNHTVQINVFSYIKKNTIAAFLTHEDLIIMDIVNTFKGEPVFIVNQGTGERWSWSKDELNALAPGGHLSQYAKFSIVFYIIMGLFLQSFAASLYTKSITFLSPLLLYSLIKLQSSRFSIQGLRTPQRIFQANFYRAFTWIGIYQYALNRRRRKVFEPFFLGAHLLIIIQLYILYIAQTKLTKRLICYKSVPRDLDGNICGLVAGIELGCLFFVRSKQGLYFTPKIIYIMITIFQVYLNFTAYGLYSSAVKILSCFIMSYFFFSFMLFEIPALELNPNHLEKPTNARPRALYQPLFSLTWYHDLPPFWTMFMPFYDRQYFNNDEMSLLDERYLEMNNYLATGSSGQLNLENDLSIELENINENNGDVNPQQIPVIAPNEINLDENIPQNNNNEQNDINLNQNLQPIIVGPDDAQQVNIVDNNRLPIV